MNNKKLLENLIKFKNRSFESTPYMQELVDECIHELQVLNKRAPIAFETTHLISFDMPYPPSVNQYWTPQSKGRFAELRLSDKGRKYRGVAAGILLSQYIPKKKILDRVSITIEVYPPDKRRRDLDNLPKGLLDAITRYEFWDDDSQVDEMRVIRKHVVKNGLIKINVRKILLTRS